MARKNNPQKTVESIIAVSAKLFMEKGYDKTSMQDIVDALGMSKGAIFHHFKSKEDILDAVMNESFEQAKAQIYDTFDDMEGSDTRGKLENLLNGQVQDPRQSAQGTFLLSQIESPHLIVALMRQSVRSAGVLAEGFMEGIADGSITTEFPLECAQILTLLLNTWCDPVVFKCDISELRRRLLF